MSMKGLPLSTPTPEGSAPDPAKKPSTAQTVIGGVVLIVVTAVCLFAVFGALGDDEPGSEDITAEIMCEGFIESELVSPASAEYTHTSTEFNDPVYTVVGYVDSDNALGATLRSDYTCEVRRSGEDEWTLLSLDLG